MLLLVHWSLGAGSPETRHRIPWTWRSHLALGMEAHVSKQVSRSEDNVDIPTVTLVPGPVYSTCPRKLYDIRGGICLQIVGVFLQQVVKGWEQTDSSTSSSWSECCSPSGEGGWVGWPTVDPLEGSLWCDNNLRFEIINIFFPLLLSLFALYFQSFYNKHVIDENVNFLSRHALFLWGKYSKPTQCHGFCCI